MTAPRRDQAEKDRILREVVYRPLGDEDLDQLAAMISAMSSYSPDTSQVRALTGDYYRWMYWRNPAGKAHTCCAIYRDTLICSFAISPKRVRIGSRELVIGKTMDMFTHPDFQGLRLMSRVSREVFEAARANGIALLYVTPSVNSYPIFTKKWGYVEAFDNHFLVRPLKPSAMLSTIVRPGIIGRLAGLPIDLALETAGHLLPPPSGYELQTVESFGPETDALWERCRGNGIALVRDSAYMNWRYRDNPDQYFQFHVHRRGSGLAGILVLKHTLRRGCRVGEIVDFLAPEGEVETRQAILRLGIERLREDGCVFVQTWSIKDSALEGDFKRSGFVIRRKKVPVLLSPGAEIGEFYDKERWFLTQGDGNDL